ncbi:hypothetical protein [Paenibacillus sp. MMS20-IR301]|uniref:hypothetical protein n=1 Tax=Paenibacillus sp. MMS20-IR301 TaxID=2895946 RepID=UPI0028EE34D9|nr:hypothetical protein [Paenibacillus sp. MMS20-IR301]WNS43662.1 hypothetical protein LOS79_32875 [Paenibacillus sp. MMS20-IR301]
MVPPTFRISAAAALLHNPLKAVNARLRASRLLALGNLLLPAFTVRSRGGHSSAHQQNPYSHADYAVPSFTWAAA